MTTTRKTVRANGYTVEVPADMASAARHLCKAANDEGVIQAEDMVEVFSEPTMHTTMTIGMAISALGGELITD